MARARVVMAMAMVMAMDGDGDGDGEWWVLMSGGDDSSRVGKRAR